MSEHLGHNEPTGYSALAWELARHASWRNWEEGVEASVVVSSATLVTGRGRTTTEAMRDLARNLDNWARSDYGGI